MIKFKNNPVKEVDISSPFAYRVHPVYGTKHHHSGNDLRPEKSGRDGDPLYAVEDGMVVISKINGGGIKSGYGYYIVVQHNGWCTLYGHLIGLDVKVGDNVKAGQQIARMGNTGTSTNTHLHFQLYNNNYSSLFFTEDKDGVDMYAIDPENHYVKNKLTWEEVLYSCLDEPDGWIKAIDTLKEMAEMSSNLGDLELMKYFDQLVVKIYEYGKAN